MAKFRRCITREEDLNLYVDENANPAKVSLDLTTNPIPPQLSILKSMQNLDVNDFHRYPEPPELPGLKREICRFYGVSPEEVMITAGADQAIEIALIHLLGPGDSVAIRIPTFPRFEIVSRRLCDARVILFEDLKKIPESKIVVLCTPNNPTTQETGEILLKDLVKQNSDKIFIIDAVFSEFGSWEPAKLVKEFDNVIILKSLSKSFSLAGLRIGCILSRKYNIDLLRRGVSPFRVPLFAQKIAAHVIKDRDHLEKSKKFLEREWKWIMGNLGSSAIRESNVPFFLLKVRVDSTHVKKELLERGISVVDGRSFKGLKGNWLRVAIGNHKENEFFVEEFKKL